MEKSYEEKEFNIKDYSLIIIKRKWIIIVFSIVLLAGTAIFSYLQTPFYQATCQVIIEKENPQVLNFQELYPIDRMKNEYYETQYQVIKSRTLTEKVVKKLKLDKRASNLEEAVQAFQKSILVEPQPDSMVVQISIVGKDPAQITKAVNTLAEVYIEYNMEIKLKAYNDTAKWFSKQLPELKERLAKSELAVQQYKEKEGIVSFEDRQSTIMDELQRINSEYSNIKTERIEKQTTLGELNKLSGDAKSLESFPAVLDDGLIKKLKENYITLETELNRVSKLYKPKHPERVSKEYQLEQLRERISEETQKIVNRIKSEYDISVAKEKELKAALDEQNSKALELNKKAIQYKVLQRETDINKQIYDSVLNRSKETEVTKVLEASNIKLLDNAVVPKTPISPNIQKNMLIALIFALLGGVSIAFFIEYIDKSIKSPDDVEQYLELPLLGVIPSFETLLPTYKRFGLDIFKGKEKQKRKKYSTENQLITMTDPTSIATEAYRNLRTNILFSANEEGLNSLLISSAIANEGKSTIVANLGVIFTYLKQKVLIIDADLRHPTIHKIFEKDNSIGLLTFLENSCSYGDIIQKTKVENLDIITSGGKTTQSSELIDSSQMQQLIRDMSKKYNLVLIDSVTAASLPDAIVLSTMVNGVIIIHLPGGSDRSLINHIKKRFLNAGAKIYGVILNNLKIQTQSHYYYPYLHSYYEYYFKESKEKKKTD
jgi:capsular exopolysaccharide synthesis family protein